MMLYLLGSLIEHLALCAEVVAAFYEAVELLPTLQYSLNSLAKARAGRQIRSAGNTFSKRNDIPCEG